MLQSEKFFAPSRMRVWLYKAWAMDGDQQTLYTFLSLIAAFRRASQPSHKGRRRLFPII